MTPTDIREIYIQRRRGARRRPLTDDEIISFAVDIANQERRESIDVVRDIAVNLALTAKRLNTPTIGRRKRRAKKIAEAIKRHV
jgi:hypothetical protein